MRLSGPSNRRKLSVIVLIQTSVWLLGLEVEGWVSSCIRESRISMPTASFSGFRLPVAPLVTQPGEKQSEDVQSEPNENIRFRAKTRLLETAETTDIESASTKLQRLKDLMWSRETSEDLTAAEFACRVETTTLDSRRKYRRRAVDFDKLLTQLHNRLSDLGCDMTVAQVANDTEPFHFAVETGEGMGSLIYSNEERNELVRRIWRTRSQLISVIRDNNEQEAIESNTTSSSLPFSIIPSFPELRVPKEDDDTYDDSSHGSDTSLNRRKDLKPKLYVRDDGTVDWDGTLQDQAALRDFGAAVWERINGRSPDQGSDSSNSSSSNSQHHVRASPPTVKIKDTLAIQQARQRLEAFKKEAYWAEQRHKALLNEAVVVRTSSVVSLASLEPAQRQRLKDSANVMDWSQNRIRLQTMAYELERIYSYLLGELKNPALKGYIPLAERLNVAEFGLLAAQVEALLNTLDTEQRVDADVVTIVNEQLNDFKLRLGIDYYVTGLTWDRDKIKQWLNELVDQTKKGLAFYVKGVQLFWNDILYCLRLVNRAAQGYTLKPREVRTIRRTFKDVITFIPVVIILIIPMTPIGHVFVFGAIQRFFPEFFPSCFTEQRQNLLELYESAEFTQLRISLNWKVSYSFTL